MKPERQRICALCKWGMEGDRCTNPRCERSSVGRRGQRQVQRRVRVETDGRYIRPEGSRIWTPR